MILADKIILLRKKQGWSQEELAEKLDVTRQSVSKWEGAQSIPDLDKILKMSRIFGVTTDYLLKEEIEERETPTVQMDEIPMGNVRYNVIGIILCILMPVFLCISYVCYVTSENNMFWPIGATIVFHVVIAISVFLFVRGGKVMEPSSTNESSLRRGRIAYEVMRIGLIAVFFGVAIYIYAAATYEFLGIPEMLKDVENAAKIIYELRVEMRELPITCVTVSLLIYKLCNIVALCLYVKDSKGVSVRKLFFYNVGALILIATPMLFIHIFADAGLIHDSYYYLGKYIWNDVLAFLLIDGVILFIRYSRQKSIKQQ